jgi:hypothetical protein
MTLSLLQKAIPLYTNTIEHPQAVSKMIKQCHRRSNWQMRVPSALLPAHSRNTREANCNNRAGGTPQRTIPLDSVKRVVSAHVDSAHLDLGFADLFADLESKIFVTICFRVFVLLHQFASHVW